MGNTSGLAITALVLGILSLFLMWIPIIGQIISIVAIVFGIISLNKIKQDSSLEGKGMAIAGIVLGGVTLLLSALMLIGMMAYFNVLSPTKLLPNKCTASSGFQCVDAPSASAGPSNTLNIMYSLRNNMGSGFTCDATKTTFSGTLSGCTATICDASGVNCETSKKLSDGSTTVIKLDGCSSSNKETFNGNVMLTCMNERSGLLELVTTSVSGTVR